MIELMTGDELIEMTFGQPLQEVRDTDGRFLGEHVASQYADGASEQHLQFNDPRDQSGRPANVASLLQVVGAWPWVLHLLHEGRVRESPGLDGMLHAARLPAAVALHRIASKCEPVPAPLSAAYKATIGYGQVLRTWRLDGEPQVPPGVHAFLAVLDAQRWLIGRDHVCPGSRRAIAEAYAILLGEDASTFADAPSDAGLSSAEKLADAARPLRDALALVEAALFSLLIAGRTRNAQKGSPLDVFWTGPGSLGVVLQIGDYVRVGDAKIAARLLSDASPLAPIFSALDDTMALQSAFVDVANAALGSLGYSVSPDVLTKLRLKSPAAYRHA